MPLVSGEKAKTEKGFKTNVKREIAAGKKPSQAVAIAYAKKREDGSDDDILEFDEKAQASIGRKIESLINRGYKPKQAEAVAFAEHRRNAKDDDRGKTFKIFDAATKRSYDLNGWPEIKDNPISKVGVFPYYGRDISPDLEPDRIYSVYRPAEELSSPETIESFKLLPWTDEHAMLGSEVDGLLPAEKKGIHGVIGEDVYYENGYLKCNIKIFSDKLANLIDKGKKELSIGYRCLYDIVSGIFDGEKYDAIQRDIRGNHLALVEEGRSGPDVAVLDHFKCTFDATEIKMPEMKREGEMKDEDVSLGECVKMVKTLAEKIDKMAMKMGGDEEGESEAKRETSEKAAREGDAKDAEGEYKKFVNKANTEDKDYDEEESEKVEDDLEEEELSQDDKEGDMSKPKDRKDKGMDAQLRRLTKEVKDLKTHGTKVMLAEISRRNALAERLSVHVGTFDHANQTFDEVASYGIKKLGLRCEKGHEAAMLEGFLAATRRNGVVAIAKDSAGDSSCVDAYLNGGKK